MNNNFFAVDKNFNVQYTVIIRFDRNIKLWNHYKNLGLKGDIDNDYCVFEKIFSDMQSAIKFYIIQQELYNIDVHICCEYIYNNKLVGNEYVDDVSNTLRVIADKRLQERIELQENQIHDIAIQTEVLKPILSLPKQEIEKIIKYANSVNQ